MNKQILLVIILGIIIAILLAVIMFLPAKKAVIAPTTGITIISPKVDQEVSSPLKITGVANGGGWNGFEGQVGTVDLYNGEGTVIMTAVLKATTDWTKPPVNFEATLDLSGYEGPATLTFKNENPSGLPDKNKTFNLPIIIKSSGETMTVKAFFNNSKLDPQTTCTNVFFVERIIPKTQAIARAALEQLLGGLTATEKDTGFYTSINSGVKIQSLTIENGIAKVDFNEQLQFQVGGSCRVSAIRAQITKTLLQFPTVKTVIISINGKTEDILQP